MRLLFLILFPAPNLVASAFTKLLSNEKPAKRLEELIFKLDLMGSWLEHPVILHSNK